MLRSMLDTWEHLLTLRRGSPPRSRRVVLLTGRLAAPALERMARRWADYAGWQPDVVLVDNEFFGQQVTVSGLLSGSDLVRTLSELPPDVEDIVLPRGAFGFDGRQTLDGIAAEEVGAAHPGRVHLASTPAELAAILSSNRPIQLAG
jgi:NifB/MoaA-like Fe-S oxidoreductase